MKILGLYNSENDCAAGLFRWLEEQGHEVVPASEKLDSGWCQAQSFDLTVSYTYSYILTGNELDALNNNVVNLHNGFLPFNRGSKPNFWSIAEGTPRGVTLHYIDEGIDSGDIIFQELVPYRAEETLYSSYMELDAKAKELFQKAFSYYEYWGQMKKTGKGKGTYHCDKDFEMFKEEFPDWSWDISIRDFRELLKERKAL